MKRLLSTLSTCILSGVLLLGCSATTAAPVVRDSSLQAPATETPLPVATVAPTQPSLKAVPSVTPPAATRTITYDGITFEYSTSLAQDTQAAVQPAVPASPDGPYWEGAPEFTQFTFKGYVLPKTFHQPRIEIYPVAGFKAANQQAGPVIDALQSYLAGTPLAANQKMPFLPLFNAAQGIHASVKNLHFQNGTGVRYLTQYDQGPMAINNYELFYTFQGLTLDSKYYVAAILPISNPVLPSDDQTRPPSNYLKYVAATVQKLESQPPSSYSPDLATLDALIASLTIHK